jgi:hypothetical protein
MAGLDPAIHVLAIRKEDVDVGTRPGMMECVALS